MQPNDDRHDEQLRGWMREWQVPETPASLEQRVLASCAPRHAWWRFLLSGYIRVPVSVVCALGLLLTGAVCKFAANAPASLPAPLKRPSCPRPEWPKLFRPSVANTPHPVFAEI